MLVNRTWRITVFAEDCGASFRACLLRLTALLVEVAVRKQERQHGHLYSPYSSRLCEKDRM